MRKTQNKNNNGSLAAHGAVLVKKIRRVWLESDRLALSGFWTRLMAVFLCLLWLAPTGASRAQTLSQNELQELFAADAVDRDLFGRSVAVSGDRAVIGAPFADSSGSIAGAVYVFERDGEEAWVEVAKLTASDPTDIDEFGHSVALLGSRVLIGARGDDDKGALSGSAYIFERNAAGTWLEVAKLTATDGQARGQFGQSVALFSNRALVGAPGEEAAYVFERDAQAAWSQVAKLTGSDASMRALFGTSVALARDIALIGAPYFDTSAGNFSGAAYLFVADGGGNWSQVQQLVASDAAGGDVFGSSVALSGTGIADTRALVGAYGGDNAGDDSGSAYLFQPQPGTLIWEEVAKLAASDGQADDRFGFSVALESTRALVGAPYNDNSAGDSGAVYLFEFDPYGLGTEPFDSASLDEVAKLTLSNAEGFEQLGQFSVTFAGGQALTGVFRSSSPGSVYEFNVVGLGDEDEDGAIDADDNCPVDFNPQQENFDGDLLGDLCDLDDDNDGIADSVDAFPEDSDRAVSCEPGFFGTFTCTAAAPGFFVGVGGQLEATACPVGNFSAVSGAAFCIEAPPGTFVSQSGQSEATACLVGTFSPTAGSIACSLASPGSFVPESGSHLQISCPVGSFSAVAGAGECELAGIGTFVSESGSSETQTCPAGTTTLAPGAGSLDDCVEIVDDTPPVTLYQHVNFRGNSLSADEGKVSIRDLRASTVGNDVISSIDIAPGYEVLACKYRRLRGRCVLFTSSVPDLRDIGFNDSISSLLVRPLVIRPITVYQHVNFRGNTFSVGEGVVSIKDLRSSGVGNDVISSIQIAPGYEVYACQHRRFRGRCETFTDSVSDLREVGLNDVISSFRVRLTP